jgi:hypothetical protein
MLLIAGGAHHAHLFPLLPALIVLAIVLCVSWRRGRRGGEARSFASEAMNEAPGAMAGAANRGAPWSRGGGFSGAPTGNSAFDEWRANELARLDEERRKLEDAQREFAEFAERVRKAKDREEFERFMSARGRPAPDPQGPAA